MQSLAHNTAAATHSGSLWRRKYIVPFVLACVILSCNQATGINSILSFLVVILRQAGMTARLATQGDVFVKLINCVMTIVAVLLVDRKGRRFLLQVGTGGIVVALFAGGFLFLRAEATRIDVRREVQAAESGNRVILPLDQGEFAAASQGRRMVMTVVYSYGDGQRMETILTDSPHPVLTLAPESVSSTKPLIIERAWFGPVPPERSGWILALCLAIFIMCYAVGPGVVVWLALSELMPTRIRSTGMGIALLLNQGISTLIAGMFLPVVGSHGYSTMFFLWAGCTVVYFLTTTFFLPETKGQSLEEIEMYFEKGRKGQTA
jgi:MFS transporter, SP family, solute carrier family 2 (myo-inositol transporter), member 13